jgi:hypothetical protein
MMIAAVSASTQTLPPQFFPVLELNCSITVVYGCSRIKAIVLRPCIELAKVGDSGPDEAGRSPPDARLCALK